MDLEYGLIQNDCFNDSFSEFICWTHGLSYGGDGFRQHFTLASCNAGAPLAEIFLCGRLSSVQTRVKKQETRKKKRFSTFAVYHLRHSETKKNIA